MKVRVLKDYKQFKQGQVTDVTPNEAHSLIELGVVRIDKMMTDYKVSGIKIKRGQRGKSA